MVVFEKVEKVKPATTWYLAEGTTAGDFDCWVMLMNPDPSGTAPVKLNFLTKEGRVEGTVREVALGRRETFHLDSYLTTYDVSTLVTSEIPVMNERAPWDKRRVLSCCWGICPLGTGCVEGNRKPLPS